MRHAFVIAIVLLATVPRIHGADVRVELNETGIAEWRFLNPKSPEPIGTDQSLEFVNTTGGRTFIVTIPFEFPPDDVATSYSLAALDRGRTMADYVNAVLQQGHRDARLRDDLENLRLLSERIQAMTAASGMADLSQVRPESITADHLETLYWTAAARIPAEERAHLATGEDAPTDLRSSLNVEAENLVSRVLGRNVAGPQTTLAEAMTMKDKYADIRVDDAGSRLPALHRAAEIAGSRFAKARFRLAKSTLLSSVTKAIEREYDAAATVLGELEDLRADDQRTASRDESARCRLMFVRTAATMIGSYGPRSKVPFASRLTTLDPFGCAILHHPDADLSVFGVNTERSALIRAATETLANAIQQPQSFDGGVEIANCAGDGKVTCVARATIPPNQRMVFSRSILERRSEQWVQFTVAFFDTAEPPANATGYAVLKPLTSEKLERYGSTSLPSEIPPKLQFNFAADAAADYALPDKGVEGHVRRSTGVGALGFQYIGPFDLSATLQFKGGEFGGAAATNQVKATQYQAKVFGPIGTILEYGKFTFAKPSSAIAVSESGEGLRLAIRRFSIGYLIRRESDNPAQKADLDDDDSYALVSQMNVPLPFLRSLLLTTVWGNEKKDVTPEDNSACSPSASPCSIPYTYSTFGFDTRFTPSRRFNNFATTVAAYHSVRNLRSDPRRTDHGNVLPSSDGKGDVALMTLTWSRLIEQNLRAPLEQSKPWFSVTGFLGYGSSDDPDSSKNESYLGENASYANDKLFLSSLVEARPALGKGLSNKYYAGIQYGNATWSPLIWITNLLKAEKEVESMSTTLTLHKYHMVRDVYCGDLPNCDPEATRGERNAGWEADAEFLIETPKNVRWSVGAAWYRRSRLVQALGIDRNPWIVGANVAIRFNAR